MEVSLADEAYESIKADILVCELEPGIHLAQSQMAQKYGIGLTPIREALRRLAHEGYVESLPRYGYIVTPITLSDVYEIYELRSVIEPGAARLATERASPAQLERILEIARNSSFTYVPRDRKSYTAYLAQNADFHLSVAIATGNQRLVNLLTNILDELSRVFHLYIGFRDYTDQLRHEHFAIAKAICDRDSDLAAQFAYEQAMRSQQRVTEALEYAREKGIPGVPSKAIELKRLGPELT
jgi:DNA-binding GntR family transcriptional regulator